MNIALASDKPATDTVARPRARAASSADRDTDDRWLVEACRRGEQRAMEALYHRYKRRVFGLVTRIAGPADAEEVAQDVFVRIYRGIGKFRGDAALGTWIYRLAVNAALTHVTRRPRVMEREDAIADLPAPSGPDRDPRLAIRLQAALEKLPAGYRAVIVLHDVEGLSHEQVAKILGCRVGTSKSQLHKARTKMRDLLGPELAAEHAAHTGRTGSGSGGAQD